MIVWSGSSWEGLCEGIGRSGSAFKAISDWRLFNIILNFNEILKGESTYCVTPQRWRGEGEGIGILWHPFTRHREFVEFGSTLGSISPIGRGPLIRLTKVWPNMSTLPWRENPFLSPITFQAFDHQQPTFQIESSQMSHPGTLWIDLNCAELLTHRKQIFRNISPVSLASRVQRPTMNETSKAFESKSKLIISLLFAAFRFHRTSWIPIWIWARRGRVCCREMLSS